MDDKKKNNAGSNALKEKPKYRFSAYYMRISFICAWLIIFAVVFGGLMGSKQAEKLADIIIPAMVALIVSLLGVHRAFGSLDYRAHRTND